MLLSDDELWFAAWVVANIAVVIFALRWQDRRDD